MAYIYGGGYWDVETEGRQKMDSKKKHPFAIQCRKCGSNSVEVYAYEYHDLGIRCKNCGNSISCGVYHTDEGDYSNAE